ncbi:MAG: flagellar export protein FliJ [Peptococcaceae bacterium]|jgi:flagellar FliJ protein|nr:flagellar export protein FliJ [Peptococcaceae bacterium]MDH7524036.1 flagellar export protein FliJ [Peptococcaceae bacterium]
MFRFRLASILRLKEYKEHLCRDEVGKCLYNLYLAQNRENEIIQMLNKADEELKCLQEGVVNLQEIAIAWNYRKRLKKELTRQQAVVAEKQKELDEARGALLEAMKEKKVLEKLREKKRRDYLYEEDKKEQSLLDELAGCR